MKTYGQYDINGNVSEPYIPKSAINAEDRKKASADLQRERERSGPQIIAETSRIAKFKNNSVTVVDVYRRTTPKLHNPNANDNLLSQNGNENAYNGYLSPATRRYVERLISVWLTSIELNENLASKENEVNPGEVFPTFITLTLPSVQLHADNTIKEKCLKPFLEWLQAESSEKYKRGKLKGQPKGFGVKGLFWRAEPQKNKNIHFHIICDKYVPWDRIRIKWNQCLERLGYVSRYAKVRAHYFKEGFRIDQERYDKDKYHLLEVMKRVQKARRIDDKVHPVFEEYLQVVAKRGKAMNDKMIHQCLVEKQEAAYENEKEIGYMNPFSSHIRAIKDLDSVTAYVVKYIAKKPTEKPLKENQVVEYSEAWGREMLHTYADVPDPITGELRREVVDIDHVKPQFEERKINGRIWGCTDIIRGYRQKAEDEIEKDEYGRSYIVTAEVDEQGTITSTTRKPVPVMQFFTKTVAEGVVIMNRSGNQLNIHYSPMETVSKHTQDYLDLMEKTIGKDLVDSISAKVGSSFERMNGRIIPLRPEKMGFKKKDKDKPLLVKHAEILKKASPELHQEYTAYYKHIYDCIYSNRLAA